MRWILKRVLANHALLDERTISAYLLPYRDDGKAIMTFMKATELLRD